MADFTDSQRIDIIAYVGLGNMTYDEAAQALNAKYGTSYSASQVGDERRKMASEAGAEPDTHLIRLASKGWLDTYFDVLV